MSTPIHCPLSFDRITKLKGMTNKLSKEQTKCFNWVEWMLMKWEYYYYGYNSHLHYRCRTTDNMVLPLKGSGGGETTHTLVWNCTRHGETTETQPAMNFLTLQVLPIANQFWFTILIIIITTPKLFPLHLIQTHEIGREGVFHVKLVFMWVRFV